MSEAVLGIVIVLLLIVHTWEVRQWSQEREFLVNRIVAKTPGEVRLLETPRPVKPEMSFDDDEFEQVGL